MIISRPNHRHLAVLPFGGMLTLGGCADPVGLPEVPGEVVIIGGFDCPDAFGFSGSREQIEQAFDGRVSRIVSRAVLQEQERYSRGTHHLYVHQDGLLWARTHDGCGQAPMGGATWWGVRTTRVELSSEGVPSGVEDACLSDTYPAVGLVTARRSDGNAACRVGHAPIYGVSCGQLEGDAARTMVVDRAAREVQVGSGPRGYLVRLSNLAEGSARLVELDRHGAATGLASPIAADPALLQIIHVQEDWWLLHVDLRPEARVRVVALDAQLSVRGTFTVPIDHFDATTGYVRALQDPEGSAASLLLATGAEAGAEVRYLQIRPDGSHGSALVLRDPDADETFDTELATNGQALSGYVATRNSRTSERRVHWLRLDCAGRLLEPTQVVHAGPQVSPRAFEAAGPFHWLVTSEGTDEPGYENVLHTIRTE